MHDARPRSRLGRLGREDDGQTVVLVGLLMTVLVGAIALSVDASRLYVEHRFLQNAVDAGALACVQAKMSGRTLAESEQVGRDTVAANLAANPLGLSVTVSPTPVYDPSVPSGPNLSEGVLMDASGCRAAVSASVPTLFVQSVNPGIRQFVSKARSFATWYGGGGFLPIVVPRWANPPGPGPAYHDNLKQEGNDSTNCAQGGPDNCPWATLANPGREFALMGQGAKAINQSSFRGNIVLDIRDFQTLVGGQPLHTGYNGVNGNDNPDTLKEFEANWILVGYPGPELCAASALGFQSCAQVAITHGNTAGKYIEYFDKRYQVGDIVMLQVYDGYVKASQSFTMSGVTQINVGTTQTISPGTISVSGSPSFPARVTATIETDPGDPLHPVALGTLDRGTLTPTCSPGIGYACGSGVPNYALSWTGLQTNSAQKGIYALWLRGDADVPYDTMVREQLVVLNVGNQVNTFDTANSTGNVLVDPKGPAASFTVNMRKVASWDNPVTLMIENCPGGQPASPPYQCYFNGDTSLNTWAMVPGGGAGTEVTLTVAYTGGLTNTGHFFRVRASGLDDDGSPVTRLIEMRLDVETAAGGSTEYVDVLGYALFKITDEGPNFIAGRAVSAMRLSPNDFELTTARPIRLASWTYAP
jgi:Flp pilus assembly protein TadG